MGSESCCSYSVLCWGTLDEQRRRDHKSTEGRGELETKTLSRSNTYAICTAMFVFLGAGKHDAGRLGDMVEFPYLST